MSLFRLLQQRNKQVSESTIQGNNRNTVQAKKRYIDMKNHEKQKTEINWKTRKR